MIVLLLAMWLGPEPLTVTDRVDSIELNSFHDDDGKLIF